MKFKHKKTTQDSDIPVKVLEQKAAFFAEYSYIIFNKAIESSKFPSSLKKTNITPVFKKGNRNQKKNYRPQYVLITSRTRFGVNLHSIFA